MILRFYSARVAELFAFDQTGLNVALLKPVTGSLMLTTDINGVYRIEMANDGIIDLCVEPCFSNMIHTSGTGSSAFWQVDLQGVYNLSSIVLWCVA